jgi:hypothetical protein
MVTTNLSDLAGLTTPEDMTQILEYLATLGAFEVNETVLLLLAIPKTIQAILLESLNSLPLAYHIQWLGILKSLSPPDCSRWLENIAIPFRLPAVSPAA